jgi:hypothetical protein
VSPFLVATAVLPHALVALDSDEGQRLLWESGARADFVPLVEHYETQKTQAYCGVASAVMVLEALPIRAPESDAYGPFRAFTQDETFWNAATKRVMSKSSPNRGGVTLDELAALLRCHPAQARAVHAGDTSLVEFRRAAVDNLRRRGDYVIANFSREEMGQGDGAHHSPLGAYHEESDQFLVLDVARYKFPPFWVPAATLFAAMQTRDPVADATRGYLLVSPAPGAPGPGHVKPSSFFLKMIAILGGGSLTVGFLLGFFVATRRAKRKVKATTAAA